MKVYLVTGGAGFIGSNFIHYMFEKYGSSIHIVNLDLLTYAGNLSNLGAITGNKNYTFIQGDICDSSLLKRLFKEFDFDFVVNFAAESHVDRSINDPYLFVNTNVNGTQTLLDVTLNAWAVGDSFKEGKRFLQVSTDEVYGSLGAEGYFTEDTPIDPHSPYAASKAAADLFVKAYYDTYKIPVNITRCSNNYGPYQFPEKLIPLMLNNALHGRDLPLYGDGKNVRDWLYVTDHCRAIDLVLSKGQPGEIYNIGGHNEKMNIEIVQLILEELNSALKQDDSRRANIGSHLIKYVKDRKGHDRRYAIDPAKIKRDLGWEPEVAFDRGIKHTIRWYLDNEQWLRQITSGEYKDYYELYYGDRKVVS